MFAHSSRLLSIGEPLIVTATTTSKPSRILRVATVFAEMPMARYDELTDEQLSAAMKQVQTSIDGCDKQVSNFIQVSGFLVILASLWKERAAI